MPPRTRPACLPKLRGQQATERLPYQRCSSTTRRHLRQVNRMDHRWVCLTLFLALLAGMTRGQECQDPLGMESGSIPDESITASSFYNDYMYDRYDDPATEYGEGWDYGAPWYARLNRDGDAWAPAYPRVGEWLQVDLGEMKNVKGTITQGRIYYDWVTSYKLQYSTDETTWTTYADTDGSEKVFPGNTDFNTPVTNLLVNPIGARYVRFLPQTWNGDPALRVEIVGCAAVDECAEGTHNCSPQATCSDTPDSFTCTCNSGFSGDGITCTADAGDECQDPLGMESGSIPDESITASSWTMEYLYNYYDDPATEYSAYYYYWDEGAPWYARLNGDGSPWAPAKAQVGEWLQVDLGEMKNVKGTITQGGASYGSYVTSYKLQYSTDGTTWTTYADTDGSEKVFPGNTDSDTPVTNLLDNPIGTRYVRFLPQTWRTHPVLRVEILGCAAGDTVATTLAPTTTAALTTGRATSVATTLAPTSGGPTTDALTTARATSVATTLAPTSGGPTTDALTTARDVDECAEGADNCSPQATCSDTPDSFTCTCNPGYTGNGVTCTDVDECASNNGGCGQTCTNNVGSFVCSCGTGYILNADGLACDDVDECANNNGGCGQTCTNNIGSFVCSCGGGYVLNADGLACDDVDECANNNGGCGQTCTNNVGSFVCSCGGGYVLNADGLACDDVDECASNNGGCGQTCTNNVGSFVCSCGGGYVLNADGLACDDVDECANNNGGCGQTCTNNVGSFVCSCGGGYILNADGLACDDVDECASNNGGCEGTCTNNVGSFDCACGAGLVLNADGLACDTCADLYPGLQPSHNFGIYQDQCFWAGNFRTPKLNYMAAKQACQAQGGTLAMIKDEATQTFLSNHLKTISGRRQRRFWIGLDDLNAEKAFLWNDGTPLGEYDLFRSSAPHRIRDCVILYRTRRMARWDIKNCDDRYPYICQLGGNGSK
ncbi:uncharacterized protein LOC144877607 isoform X4 [Branchiostoma floridae x Branchiostoma japonicum]